MNDDQKQKRGHAKHVLGIQSASLRDSALSADFLSEPDEDDDVQPE